MFGEIISASTKYRNINKRLSGAIHETLLELERNLIGEAVDQKHVQNTSLIQCHLQTELES